jgi:hypothetical protein
MNLPSHNSATIMHCKLGSRTPGRAITAFVLIMVFVAFASQLVAFQAIAIVTLACFVFSFLHLWPTATIAEKRAVQLVFLVLTISWPVAQIRNTPAMGHYIVVLLSLISAFILTRDLHVYLFASRWLLIGTLASIFIYLSNTGLENFPLEEMIPGGSSSNGVTSYLIIAQINYCIVRYIVHRKPSLLTPMLTLFVCYVGFGRASLLAALAIIFINTVIFPPKKYRFLVTILLGIMSIKLYSNYEADITYLIDTTKLGAGLYDRHREDQLIAYLNNINVVTFFTGASYYGTVIADTYFGNPHNSYIRAHHIFGFLYLMTMMFFPLILLSSRALALQLIYPMILIIILLFRAITETILFPTMLDIFFFAICFATQNLFKNSVQRD